MSTVAPARSIASPLLLDTHAVIWMLLQPELLSDKARAQISDTSKEGGRLLASAASLYEIALKAARGRWTEVAFLLDRDITAELEGAGLRVLPVTGEIMQAAGALDWSHRDPFDRLIAVTGARARCPVVSADATLDSVPDSGFARIW